jgi:hypothetical protein
MQRVAWPILVSTESVVVGSLQVSVKRVDQILKRSAICRPMRRANRYQTTTPQTLRPEILIEI